MVSVIEETALTHAEGALPVRVKVTEPADMSAALGVYTGFKRVASLKVPVPLVVQFRLTALEAEAPASV
jgi:hypothetical protein